jgi:hypothetical protein
VDCLNDDGWKLINRSFHKLKPRLKEVRNWQENVLKYSRILLENSGSDLEPKMGRL